MPISSNRYVDITSGVGGAAAVGTRELLLRLYTSNELVPTGGVISFSSADAVRTYFGSASEEYKQAVYYFGFVSKVITQPKNIQFARWAPDATSSQIFGSAVATLDTQKAFTSGSLVITIGGVATTVTLPSFATAVSYAAIATLIQTAAQTAAGPLAAATVTYNASRVAFEFDSNEAEDGAITITSPTAGLLSALGWGAQAVLSDGIAAQSVTDVVSLSTQVNNNYGSFAFIDDLTLAEVEEAASWNNARNVEFQYHQKVSAADAADYSAELLGYAGTGLTLYDIAVTDQYPWLLPCAILASQQWDKPAASANYKYQTDARLTATVGTDALADTYDALRVNYYGVTQEAGAMLSFYQRGQLMGGATAPTAMGVYANEQWFKAGLKSAFLNMFLALNQVPADEVGESIGYSYIDAAIEQAKFNGVIATGKDLTNTQKAFITQLTGDESAWRDVASKGFWRTVAIASETDSGGVTTYYMDYTIVYAKRDSVDRVQGRHVLI